MASKSSLDQHTYGIPGHSTMMANSQSTLPAYKANTEMRSINVKVYDEKNNMYGSP
jgi:hypothetical protein